MELFLILLLFALGIVLVVKGGDYFVDAASWIAEVSGIPKLIIGATVVSIATTLPEMLVSVMAARDSLSAPTEKAAQGLVDISIGNAVGSVTANIGLIMAISLLCMPGAFKRKDYMFKSLTMLLAAIIIVACGFFGKVSILLSVLLIALCVAFFIENVMGAKKAMVVQSKEVTEKVSTEKKDIIVNILKFVFGAAGIIVGARLLVDNGTSLARILHISERIIGVTLVAVGTSLPELITTITAVAKKQADLSVGNIIGANIMDLTLIMPLSSIISGKGLNITAQSAYIDLPACLLVGLIAVLPSLLRQKTSRFQGGCLLAVYIAYVAVTCIVVI